MFDLTLKAAKEGFFDRALVLSAIDKANVRNLNTIGRKVRATAQRSIVYAQGVAPSGTPPHGHRGGRVQRISKKTGKRITRAVSLLREYLFYSYDRAARSVIIGPVRLSNTLAKGDAPSALEYGGSSLTRSHGKVVRVSISPHPYMHPAAKKELPGFVPLYRNSISN